MLNMLASGDMETFRYYAEQDYSMVKHLIGYGIVQKTDEYYDFKIDAIRDYLLRKQRRKALVKTPEEKWAYVCSQRNALETKLRRVVRVILRIAYKSETYAKEMVILKIYGGEARKYATYSYAGGQFDVEEGDLVYIPKGSNYTFTPKEKGLVHALVNFDIYDLNGNLIELS